MGDSWETMESEMDRFEAEISSLVKPPSTSTTPAFIPASLRKAPMAPPPPRPKLTPVVISGGPQLYITQRTRTPLSTGTPTSLMRPTQLSQPRLIRPSLILGLPGILPSAGHSNLMTDSTLRMIPPPPPNLASNPEQSTSTRMSSLPSSSSPESEKPSTSTPASHVHDTNSATTTNTSASKNKKKKKKQSEGEKKPRKHIRSAGGTIWEDTTLLDWDPKDFRLFCGDLGNDVTDEVLTRVFGRYPSFVKAKVIRDKRSNKTKGYGFVSFKDPADFVKAIRELDGRYVGSRPIKLRKSTWENRGLSQVRKREKLQKQLLGIIKPSK